MVSFGVIVQNTSSNWVATATKLTVSLAESSGASVEDVVEHGQYSVHATFPQHRTGFGAEIYVGSPGAARITVQVGASTWYPRTNAGFAEVTTTGLRTQRRTGSATFTFALSSAYHWAVTGRYLYFIFRDQTGQLIGGAGGGGDVSRPCYSVSPGASRCTTEVHNPLPAGTVDARTEVYINGD